MRVCLINPPRIQPKLWGKPSILQPLDIAYVAAVLEKKHSVHIIDVANEGWENPAYEVASIINGIDENIATVLTGLDPSARPKACLSHPNIDFVVIGEPEETMRELVEV